MHVLPRVREIHERFPDVLTVLGIHAGKFRAERETPRIAAAVQRLHVAHPVVNDRHVRIWRAYGVSAWPTIALVAPDGELLGVQAGEFEVETLADTIARLVEEYASLGVLRRGPDPIETVPLEQPGGLLGFPTRTLLAGGRLYVSDPGRYRLLEAELLRDAGALVARVTRVWGGSPGFADGSPDECRFGEPQGLAAVGGSLFLADRSNHAVRRISMDSGEVSTCAGTGALAPWRVEEGAARTPLRSPWGLMSSAGGGLLVTMAGSHQIFEIVSPEAPEPSLRLIAGTGAEDIRDGRALDAQLAQPTAVSPSPQGAIFADCESSAIRELAAGEVRTLVGTGLFDFGDRDGSGPDVLLQHAEDAIWRDGSAYVADTYNDKIKRVGASGSAETIAGAEPGVLFGPRGLLPLGDSLLVADTDARRLAELTPSGEVLDVRVEG